jgi:hypothetical protein
MGWRNLAYISLFKVLSNERAKLHAVVRLDMDLVCGELVHPTRAGKDVYRVVALKKSESQ